MDLGFDTQTKQLTGGAATAGDALAQRLYLRLARLAGEWFLSVATGLPGDVLTRKPANLAVLRYEIARQLREVEGVADIVSLDVSLTTERRARIVYVVRGSDGTTAGGTV